MKRRGPATLLCFILAALLLFGCAPAEENTADEPALTSCTLAGDLPADCGTLTVPENYAQPDGRQLEIHYAVVPAAGSRPEADPVFMLAGGPGQAAIETFPFIIRLFSDLNQSRDIVLVDQRGTGQSAPLACPQFADLPPDPSEELQLETLETCRQELAAEADLTQYITSIAMRDLDAVRAELGYDQINLFGTSYGSRAAQEYMRLYPERVRTAVLNAVTSPELVLQLQAPADGGRALNLLFARCANDDACSDNFPNFEQDFYTVAADLGAGQDVTFNHPVTGERLTVNFSEEDLLTSVFNLLYSPDLIALMPLLITAAAETGDYGPLVAHIVAFTAGLQTYTGMFYAVACSEDAALLDLDEAAQLRGDSPIPLLAADFLRACENWPRADVPADFRTPLQSDTPTLILSGDADPITPPSYAESVAAGLSDNVQITLPDYGHDISAVSCIPSVITQFIQAGMTAELDTSCTAEIVPPPFFVSPTGPLP